MTSKILGGITMDVPLHKYWGHMPPCPIGIDASGISCNYRIANVGVEVVDGRRQLQLAVHVSVRLPRRRGEDCHLAQGQRLLVGRDRNQDSRATQPSSLGRRPLLGRRLSRYTTCMLQYRIIGLTPMAVGLSQSLAQWSGTVSRISSGTRQSALTLSDVCWRRICLCDTSACSALDNFMCYINLLTYLLMLYNCLEWYKWV